MYTIDKLSCYKRECALSLAIFVFLIAGIIRGHAEVPPLAQRINVESRLSAYLNCESALMVFERRSTGERLVLQLTFVEQSSGVVPCGPVEIVLEGDAPRSESRIDISTWPDGEYKVLIAEKSDATRTIIRGIRKQTITRPRPPQGVRNMDNSKMFFIDDWHIESSSNLTRRVNPAEMLPVEPWKSKAAPACARNSIQNFWFNQQGVLYVNIRASEASQSNPTNYWVESNDLQNWRTTQAPDGAQNASNLTWRGIRGGQTSSGARFRRYNPDTDGPVDLSQVNVR